MSIRLPENEEEFTGLPNAAINPSDGQSVISFDTKFKESLFYRFIKFQVRFKILYLPPINWIMLGTLMLLLYKLIHRYESMYQNSVLLTTITTNTLLFGFSDTLAQSISCVLEMISQERRARLRSSFTLPISLEQYQPSPHLGYRDQPDDSFYSDYGDTRVSRHRQNSVQSVNSQYQLLSEQTDKDVFNFRRFIGFVFWGANMAFVQVAWYWILNHFFTTDPTLVSVFERVLSDQLFFSPISLFCFFTYSNFVLEGGDKVTLSEKISKIYLSTLVANWCVWPLVQFINFLIMPRRFQVPFSSSSKFTSGVSYLLESN
ncbi:CYFA0S14e03246g1_1 [Cyberlindnera fabianii]|uniref:CYFA0S14e03246g1_1 n=1 Tax=Cyberlindnera fabianii TaxID=36022 RepID=A0A061B9C4_CYBFA|nr:Protein sym1 [Cyberlindnera fabianii]CDR44489.1 CYFA0S14e03246g1_1 [Cyberlindnera fabianii]